MDNGVLIVGIVVGLPVVGGLCYAAFEEYQKSRLKAQQLRIEEKKLAMEEKLRNDELNAKILQMDDLGLTGAQIASLMEEVTGSARKWRSSGRT